MGWWSLSSAQGRATAEDAHMREAQSAIASIFEPGHRSLAPPPPAASASSSASVEAKAAVGGGAAASASPVSSSTQTMEEAVMSGWEGITRRVREWLPLSSSSTGDTTQASTPAAAAAAASPPVSATAERLTWDQLPPSPLAGYTLTRRGLTDELCTPPHTLTAPELKALIHELTTVEQKAKYDVDVHFTEHVGRRSLHGLELLINPCLFLVGLYLMTYKTVQLYSGALPQDSVVFTRLLALLRSRMPASKREALARRHRQLMRATNARVALTFATGVSVVAIACVSRPSRNVMEDAPDMQTSRELAAFQQHAAASVKWCWYVYYHHPAYRALTNP